jgi:hypothetical protein
MKVRALIMFNDLKAKKLRKENELFEVSSDRASELNAGPHGVLVEIIDKVDIPVKPETKPTMKGGGAGVRKNKNSSKN